MAFWEAVGIAAIVCIVLSWLPQVIKSWQTRRMKDLSWGLLSVYLLGSVLLLAYSIHLQDIIYTVMNAIVSCLALLLIGMKFSFEKK